MPDQSRRGSLGRFFRPTISPLTPIRDPRANRDAPKGDGSPHATLKKRNPKHVVSSPSGSLPGTGPTQNLMEEGFRPTIDHSSPTRPPSRHIKRPSSIFDPFRNFPSLQDEDGTLHRTNNPMLLHSPPSGSGHPQSLDVGGAQILHSGEIRYTEGMFRKKSYFLVLTANHLVRFKSRGRAEETFPILLISSEQTSSRHSRISSSGSAPENSSDGYSAIPLNHVVAVHNLDDGRPFFSIEIAYTDELTDRALVLTFQLNDPGECDIWLSSIRGAAIAARLAQPLPFAQHTIEYTARALEQERDYDPDHFQMFKVVQRATKSGARSSSDDLSKVTSSICILAIGAHKVHLVPLPKSRRNASSTSLADVIGASHGIMALTSLTVQNSDDKFELNFRIPLCPPSVLTLASAHVTDIALCIRHAADYLRPEWLEQPFTWNVCQVLDNQILPISSGGEDHACLDRTLTAYCAAYDLDTSNIRYLVDYECESAPGFQLLPAADSRSADYSLLELLAIMRALRYNETFASISFANIKLDLLHGRSDQQGWDHVAWTTRSGEPLDVLGQESSWLLVQEVRALAVKSRKLRRLDFSFCLSRKPGEPPKEGSGLCEALFPLCLKQVTNVDWIIFNGIHLADIDIDFFFAATIEKKCHFRALDLGGCGLMDQAMHTVLHAISYQGATMESIDLSGNLARIDPKLLQVHICKFGYIRKINLSNISRTSGPEPLLNANIFLAWKLEEINLSRTNLNEQTIAAISKYLKSPQSDTLRSVRLDQCQLTGSDLAILLRAMHREPETRDLHLFVTENRLEQHHEKFVHALSRSITPTRMTMQMLEYSSEHYFGELMEGLAKNKSLQYLDISKASLPKDASDGTSEALRRMFAKNQTLEVLDLSGEEAHLEVANFGIGLNHALTGLKNNKTLRALRIERQKLGLQGASTLASVLEENRGLQEIHCEHNDINLQAFTVLVNSLEANTSMLFMPVLDGDKLSSLRKVDREIDSIRGNSTPVLTQSAKVTMRRTLGAAMATHKAFSSRFHDRPRSSPHVFSSDKEVKAVVGSLSQQWERENARLESYLQRNWQKQFATLRSAEDLGLGSGEADLDEATPLADTDKKLCQELAGVEISRGEVDFELGKEIQVDGARREADAESGLRNTEVDSGLGKEIEIEIGGESGVRGGRGGDDDDESESEVEELVDLSEGDDISAALMMTKSLNV